MDTSFIRNLADAGNTVILGYLLLVLGPRFGGKVEALARWCVETALAEMRAARGEHLTALRFLSAETCRFKTNGQPAAIAAEAESKQSV